MFREKLYIYMYVFESVCFLGEFKIFRKEIIYVLGLYFVFFKIIKVGGRYRNNYKLLNWF